MMRQPIRWRDPRFYHVADSYVAFSFMWFIAYLIYTIAFPQNTQVEFALFACLGTFLFMFICIFIALLLTTRSEEERIATQYLTSIQTATEPGSTSLTTSLIPSAPSAPSTSSFAYVPV